MKNFNIYTNYEDWLETSRKIENIVEKYNIVFQKINDRYYIKSIYEPLIINIIEKEFKIPLLYFNCFILKRFISNNYEFYNLCLIKKYNSPIIKIKIQNNLPIEFVEYEE